MKKYRNPLLFSLAMIPAALIGGFFVCKYQIDLYDTEIADQMINQIGSEEKLLWISAVQSVIYAVIFGFLGYILSEKTGLMRSFRFEKRRVCLTLILTFAAGILFSLDYWTFGRFIPQIRDSCKAGLTGAGFLSAVFYGGIVEELLLRLFFMSLLAFLLWKIFFRKETKDQIPVIVFSAANIVSAFLFAAGHLPATVTTFGGLTPLIIFRCFLLNGAFGLLFGWLYRKHGIQYAMLSHMGIHIISRIIWNIV